MSRSKRNAAAADYFRRAPGYSAEAIPHLRLWARGARDEFPISATRAEVFASFLESAHKFALPIGGLVFEEDGFSEAMIESFRLPYPVTAFEFDAPKLTGEEFVDRFHQSYWPKRIVLCVDTTMLPNSGHEIDEPACFVFPISYSGQWWCPSWAGVVIPYQQEAIPLTKDDIAERRRETNEIGLRNEDGSEYSFKGFAIRCQFVPFGDFGRSQFDKYGDREVFWRATVDTRDEVNAAVQACAALSCTNVTTEIIRPNREAHAIRPASTLFDYHILVLDPSRVREPGEPLGGSHASPRTHLRRGHIRRHPTAGRIWVNSCVVNPSAIGTVNKDYRVKA